MRITVLFQFNHDHEPAAITGIAGNVVDLLLPSVGDVVTHRDTKGEPFRGRVTDRVFAYDLPDGIGVDGAVTVTLCLDRTIIH